MRRAPSQARCSGASACLRRPGAAMDLLLSYPWPGNVRELEHAIERLLVTCDSNRIVAEDLPFVISQADVATAQIASRLAATTPNIRLGEKLEFEAGGLDLPK